MKAMEGDHKPRGCTDPGNPQPWPIKLVQTRGAARGEPGDPQMAGSRAQQVAQGLVAQGPHGKDPSATPAEVYLALLRRAGGPNAESAQMQGSNPAADLAAAFRQPVNPTARQRFKELQPKDAGIGRVGHLWITPGTA